MHSLLTLTMLMISAPQEPVALLQLSRGQEFVYRGQSEATARGATFTSRRQWDVVVHVFVLETADDKAQLAVLTNIREANAGGETSARLVLADIDYLGRIQSRGEPFAVALESPSVCDANAFIELPAKPLHAGTHWEVNDAGRPPLAWTVQGFDRIANGPRCVQLVGEQNTPGFHELGTHREWRRLDHVWLDSRGGFVRKLERIIDLRDPSRREVTARLVTKLELESSMVIPERLAAERRAEIAVAWQAEQATIQFASSQAAPRTLESLSRRIAHHINQQPVTAYREGVVAAQRRLESVRSGVIQPTVAAKTIVGEVATGEAAPDFVATELATGASVRLGGKAERPVVLVFFRPGSQLSVSALRAAANLNSRATIAGLCVSDAPVQGMHMARDCGVTIPIYDGREAAQRYGGTATPRFVVIDENGVVRQLIDGYGSEVESLLAKAVESTGSAR